MPRDVPRPEPFEPEWLERSLDRYLAWGLVFMVLLLIAFPLYRVREPDLRADALRSQQTTYRALGADLFDQSCASCHGPGATGGGAAPTLDSAQFLTETADRQMQVLVASGIPGSDMAAWSVDFGGPLTDEQVTQIVTYLRSLEADAPSIPDWRRGAQAEG